MMQALMKNMQNRYSFLDNLFRYVWKSIIQFNYKLKLQLRNIRWKNAKAKPGSAYQPTEVGSIYICRMILQYIKVISFYPPRRQIEQVANVITHGIWIVPAIFAAIKLFERSNSYSQYLVSWVYGTALCMLFTISTFFHCSCYCVENK